MTFSSKLLFGGNDDAAKIERKRGSGAKGKMEAGRRVKEKQRGKMGDREREGSNETKERKIVKVKKFREKLCSAIKLLNCQFRHCAQYALAHVRSSVVVKFMIRSRIIAI